ncbi:MAG: WbuC family cupin fold metalloprotein [Nitrospiraceae bacterium]|nr:WbuC family cupin fold metalloprotein [Nitrospiraceae bacterium]
MRLIDDILLSGLSGQADASPRKRMNHNFHETPEDPVQRLLNAVEPGTYIRPHRHSDPATWEVLLLVRGSAVLLVFDGNGKVAERIVLAAGGPVKGAELRPGIWHTIASLERGTIFYEVKRGPYRQPKGEHSASWAPAEGDPACAGFVRWFELAGPDDNPPKGEK